MATITELQTQVDALTVTVNAILANASTITDLTQQTPIDQTSEMVLSLSGVEKKVTVSQLMKFINGTVAADAVFTGANVGIGTAVTRAALSMGDDSLVAFDVNAGITASVTQTQGNGALTAQTNEISVCANPSDTVTLPTAVAGLRIVVMNNGANTLQIFPASGDNLGVGVDTSTTLQSGEVVFFEAYDTTNWKIIGTSDNPHAQMYDQDNTDAFVVSDPTGDFQSYHTNGLAASDADGITFDAGGAGTSFPIASIADGADSGVDIEVTTTGSHGLAVGDIISQSNLADAAYVGVFVVKDIISVTQYEVAAVYTATDTGTMDQAATLTVGANSAGHYQITWAASGTSATSNESFDFQLYNNATVIAGTKSRRKFSTATDYGSFGGVGIEYLESGDTISLALTNLDSANNVTIRNLTIVMHRI